MAGTLADVWVTVRGKVNQLKADVAKGSKEAGETAGKGFTASFGNLLKGLGALFAGQAILGFLKSTIAEARESVVVSNLTTAAIKSTGGAAHVTAGQVGELANSLSAKVGVDDEAVQSGENLLLTFTRIRNEAGKGNDIFNQTSAAVLDMTAAMNRGVVSQEGIKTATIQLGKALNDPLKGMTALSKVGVTFSAGQKAQIANLIKHNDLLGAQKVILAEVNREFGGAAAAAADPAQKAMVAWANLKEMLGGLVLPTINRILTAFSTGLPAAISTVGDAFDRVKAAVMPLVPDVIALVTGLIRVGSAIAGTLLPFIRALATTLGAMLGGALAGTVSALASFVTWLTGATKPASFLLAVIKGVAAGLLIYATYLAVVRVATIAWTVVQTILNFALTANPIGIIIVAIAALVAAIIWVATKTQFFQTVWGAVWGFLKAVGAWFAGPFAGFFVAVWNKLVALFNYGKAVIVAVALDVHSKWSAVINFFSSIPSRISAIFSAIKNFIMSHMNAAATAAAQAASRLVSTVIGFFQSLPGRISGALGGIKNAVLGAVSGAASWLVHAGEQLIQGLINGIKNMAGKVAGAVGDVLAKARNLLPFSPAKEGPFSGRGWTFYSGQSIIRGLMQGMASAVPELHAQLSATLGSVQVAAGGTSSPASSPGMTFSPTYHVAGTMDEQQLARATVARLLFALNTGGG